MRAGTAGRYVADFQVTLNWVPVLLSGPGCALTFIAEFTMVISESGNEEIVPAVPAVTAAPFSVQVPKLASGRTPDALLGASAIHSALELAHVAHVLVLEKVFPAVVESVTLIA